MILLKCANWNPGNWINLNPSSFFPHSETLIQCVYVYIYIYVCCTYNICSVYMCILRNGDKLSFDVVCNSKYPSKAHQQKEEI